jgi:hypothetical protein
VQSYVELLVVDYFALVLYFWKQDSGSGDLTEVENATALALYCPQRAYADIFLGLTGRERRKLLHNSIFTSIF